jgi:hypothetical protein
MDIQTGNIRHIPDGEQPKPTEIPVEIPLTPYQRETMRIGRNDLCPCRSGKKFKNCHYKIGWDLNRPVQFSAITNKHGEPVMLNISSPMVLTVAGD